MTGLFTTSVFPGDPWALPAPQQRVQARRQLLELPGAYLDANTYEYLRWVGHGGGRSGPGPAVRAAGGGWTSTSSSATTTACRWRTRCDGPRRAAVPMWPSTLSFGWPWETGYARLVLLARTRQRPPKARVIRAAMGAVLGCPVRVYQEMPAGPRAPADEGVGAQRCRPTSSMSCLRPVLCAFPEVEDQARRWFGQAMPGGWEVTSTVMAPMGFIHAVEAGGDIH